MPFQPELPDRVGRGALCEEIETLAKTVMRTRPDGERPDSDEVHRVTKRLDEARTKFHKLYGFRPDPGRATT